MIGDLVRRYQAAADEQPPDDLLNGPHKLCECGSPGCGCPIALPKRVL